jgi:hypothetical protein
LIGHDQGSACEEVIAIAILGGADNHPPLHDMLVNLALAIPAAIALPAAFLVD